MRIIAGSARGRKLAAPKGEDTRPTLDRVRESLFNILTPRLFGAQVLDLFAGSGALGLEALSRGAEYAVFSDWARSAQETVLANINTLGMQEQTRLLKGEWQQTLRILAEEGQTFDLIFLDPPYKLSKAGALLDTLAQGALLREDALVVYEHGRERVPDLSRWQVVDERGYGDTVITFLQK